MRNKLELMLRSPPETETFEKLKNSDLSVCLNRLPEEIYDLLQQHARTMILAGGYIRALVAKEKPRDIDLFVPDKDLAESIANSFEGTDLVVSDKAYSLESGRVKVQLVFAKSFSSPEGLLRSFDYSICKAAIFYDGSEFTSTISSKFYIDIKNKILRYEHPAGGLFPAEQVAENYERSIIRSHKFYELGYRPTNEMKMYADS